ncbi:MAG: hypothetical protein EGW04_06085 [Rothia mucilaginosa]|nr:hypothetical protein [Rothia mucilaginosa]
MTLLNTSGVLVILTVILLLWFVPRSLRRAPVGHTVEPERPLISAERTPEDILASAGVLLNESEAYQSSDHAVAPGTSLPSSALPRSSSSSHAVGDSAAPQTASISQIRDSSPVAPYTGEIPMVEEPKQSLLSSLDTSTPSGVAYLVAAGAGVAAVLCLLLALFGLMPWAWFVIFAVLGGVAWGAGRFGLADALRQRLDRRESEDDNDDEQSGIDGDDERHDREALERETEESAPVDGERPAQASAPKASGAQSTRRAGSSEESFPKPPAPVAESRTQEPRTAENTDSTQDAPAHRQVEARPAAAVTRHAQHPGRRPQRSSRFQPIRRGSVLFDQESGSGSASQPAPRATEPKPSSEQVVAAQPVPPVQPTQQAPRVAPRVESAEQVAVHRAATAQESEPHVPTEFSAPRSAAASQERLAVQQAPQAVRSDQPAARPALRDGSPVRPAAQQAPAPIPEEIPLPDVLDDSEFDALDIASLSNPATQQGSSLGASGRAGSRHPGGGSSFEAVSNTWNPVQLPKPLSALHRENDEKNSKK